MSPRCHFIPYMHLQSQLLMCWDATFTRWNRIERPGYNFKMCRATTFPQICQIGTKVHFPLFQKVVILMEVERKQALQRDSEYEF